jgi:glycosyltransferase involved in cell wall biosynthesis
MEQAIPPMVSIIMPAHNAANTIADAMESVLNQSHESWQLIIIENGSTDSTFKICTQFNDPRIHVIRHPEAGLSRARNIGIDAAKGEFICFLDADDQLPEDSLSIRLDHFIQHPDTTYCDGLVLKLNESLSTTLEFWQPQLPFDLGKEMSKINSVCFCGVTWMIRRHAIGTLRFDPTWSHLEDRKFFFELAQHGHYNFVPEVVYQIRKRRGSLMTNHNQLQNAYLRFLSFAAKSGRLTEAEQSQQYHVFRNMFVRTHLKSGRIGAALAIGLKTKPRYGE